MRVICCKTGNPAGLSVPADPSTQSLGPPACCAAQQREWVLRCAPVQHFCADKVDHKLHKHRIGELLRQKWGALLSNATGGSHRKTGHAGCRLPAAGKATRALRPLFASSLSPAQRSGLACSSCMSYASFESQAAASEDRAFNQSTATNVCTVALPRLGGGSWKRAVLHTCMVLLQAFCAAPCYKSGALPG